MKALCWNGPGDLRVERVRDPVLVNPHDVIVKVTLSSVCGSDLPLLDGHVPTMRPGDIIGREFLGEIVEKGAEVRHLNRGDRVVVMSVIGCGHCGHCRNGESALCDNSNPNPERARAAYGHCGAGLFGHSHAFGGYAGSHADYVRVPYADFNAIRVPEGVSDETAVFLSDTVPTGYMAAEMAGIRPGDVVAVWGCGAVGQMAIHSAHLLGAGRVIGIDRVSGRLRAAQMKAGAETLDYGRVDVFDSLQAMTGGRGPDACIDAVGMDADDNAGDGASNPAEDLYDRGKRTVGRTVGRMVGQAVEQEAVGVRTDRPAVLRQMIESCRKGGTLSIVGEYGGLIDRFPLGAAMNKGLAFRMGRQNGQRSAMRLFEHIGKGELDPSYLMTHRLPLDDGPQGYRLFKDRAEDCLRVVFAPHS
ncbi:alcohol dehydrogenase [Azospirillum thiophilum]|uniref:Alcohol dehydrogenase n=1 Tax=Azospirillum thiophilum TaxID=528244 RepID=A0AAC8VX61_9PROT|nr:zinc-dependent alcohol dehydrogenase [Azospirillum thiophilum]ALG71157.1 alcohol dehydrogenase [Azospirillum thiophilum]KJR65187.1 alcohol dehydrogenase [Azospirillum thiophilum]